MSRQMNNRNADSRNTACRKPYCKVCHDAGKPESEYTNHYVRSLPDRQGNTKVTCPTLLNTECRYCYELGHTAKFCPVIAARKKDDERIRRQEERKTREEQKPVQKAKAPTNVYHALYESDNEEEVVVAKPVVVEEWPALGAPSQRVTTGNYASAAAKPAPVTNAVAKQVALPAGFVVLKKGATYEKTETPKQTFATTKITNWADWDTDDEEEEDRRYEAYAANVDNNDW